MISYVVSPFALIWDNQNYYLIAYDADAGFIKHYRVDKMTDIETIAEERSGMEVYQTLDMSGYTEKVFGMFAGKEVLVRIRFAEHLAGAARNGHNADAGGGRGVYRHRRSCAVTTVFRMDYRIWHGGEDPRPRAGGDTDA